MVFIRFSSFILAILLVSFALQSLSVHGVHHQERRLLEGHSIKETQEHDASLRKTTNNHFEHVQEYVRSGARIGGRKMGRMLKEDGERSISTGDHVQKLKTEAGFVAFTADYHMAKHHPPRHN